MSYLWLLPLQLAEYRAYNSCATNICSINDYNEGFQRRNKKQYSLALKIWDHLISFSLGRPHFRSRRWGKGETITIFFLNFIFLYSTFLLVIYFIHISVYKSIPISHFIPPPPHTPAFPPWPPYVCSLHLCLYFCLANQFICTIFLDSTYIR